MIAWNDSNERYVSLHIEIIPNLFLRRKRKKNGNITAMKHVCISLLRHRKVHRLVFSLGFPAPEWDHCNNSYLCSCLSALTRFLPSWHNGKSGLRTVIYWQLAELLEQWQRSRQSFSNYALTAMIIYRRLVCKSLHFQLETLYQLERWFVIYSLSKLGYSMSGVVSVRWAFKEYESIA